MRFLNLLANKFFALLFSWLLGQQVRDTLCGTKALYREDYERIAANRAYFGDFDPFGDFDLLFGAVAAQPAHRRPRRALPRAPVRRDEHLALPPRLAAAAHECVRRAQAEAAVSARRAAEARSPPHRRSDGAAVALAVPGRGAGPVPRRGLRGRASSSTATSRCNGTRRSKRSCTRSASGSWPVWNPYISFGQPLLANPNAQILYPITWLHLLMPAWTFYAWYVVFHFVAGRMRHLRARPPPRASREAAPSPPGLLWVLSGPFLSLVNLWHHLAGAGLAAVGRAGLETVRSSGSRLRRTLTWGVLLAVLVVCGSPETLADGAVGGSLSRRSGGPGTGGASHDAFSRRRAGAMLAFAVAAALSAGQWLPTARRRALLPSGRPARGSARVLVGASAGP